MKVWQIRTLKILSMVIALIIPLSLLQGSIFNLWEFNARRVYGFYLEDPNSLDVVLLGASEIINDYSSLQAYQEYGFTSYPFAVDSNNGMVIKSQLKEVLNRQSPKAIVIEVNGFLYEENDPNNNTDIFVTAYFENMPLSWNKLDTLLHYRTSFVNKAAYLFPFIRHHQDWENYGERMKNYRERSDMRHRGHSRLKGISNFADYSETACVDITDIRDTEPLSSELEDSLRDLLDYIQEKGIDNVIFTRFPHMVADNEEKEYMISRYRRCNQLEEILGEYGVPLYNFDRDHAEIGLDYPRDFYNNDHMNVFGMQKFTSYFGRMLQEQFGVTPTQLTEEQEDAWVDCLPDLQKYYAYAEERTQRHAREDLDDPVD